MCFLDKDLLPFRASVVAVASLQTCLNRLANSSEYVENFSLDSEKTLKSIEHRVWTVISEENNSERTNKSEIGIKLEQFKQQVEIVSQRLNFHFNNERALVHKTLTMNQTEFI